MAVRRIVGPIGEWEVTGGQRRYISSLKHQAGDLRCNEVKVHGGVYLSYQHFPIVPGLGKHERIDCLGVKWPLLGSETQRFNDLLIDRFFACDCRR